MSMKMIPALHSKMCKKIADLTKVVQMLNTKIDKHEEAIAVLTEVHEEDVQQIKRFREKILYYKSESDNELELKRQVQSLEESLKLEVMIKKKALAEFDNYKQKAEDMQDSIYAEHTKKVGSLLREMDEMRQSFEAELCSFKFMQSQLQQEKTEVLQELNHHKQEQEKLVELHKAQVDSMSQQLEELNRREQEKLMELHKAQVDSMSQQLEELNRQEQEKLMELHKAQVDSMSQQLEELKQDKKSLVQEQEAKLSEAQACHEFALEAMQVSQQQTTDDLLALTQQKFKTQEEVLQKSLGTLRSELARVTDENERNNEKCNKLQSSLNNAENIIKNLNKKLAVVTQNPKSEEICKKKAESELEAARDKVQQQSKELLIKTCKITWMQASQKTQEDVIRDLTYKHSQLNEKVLRLEEEREATLRQALEKKQKQQILYLQKGLQKERASHKIDRDHIQARYEEEVRRMKNDRAKTLKDESRKHSMSLTIALDRAEKEKTQKLTEMEQQFQQERLKLGEQKRLMQQQLEKLREELTTKLITKEETDQLKRVVRQGKQDLDIAQREIFTLKKTHDKLLEELDTTKECLRKTSTELTALQQQQQQQQQAQFCQESSRLENNHTSAFEQERTTLQQMLTEAKMELKKNKSEQLKMMAQITELQEEVSHGKSHTQILNNNIKSLRKELELMGKERLKIRSEASQQIRNHERDLFSKHEQLLSELKVAHSQVTKNTSDFHSAQEGLKDKISAQIKVCQWYEDDKQLEKEKSQTKYEDDILKQSEKMNVLQAELRTYKPQVEKLQTETDANIALFKEKPPMNNVFKQSITPMPPNYTRPNIKFTAQRRTRR